jgi:secreted trypsin-like serine protease
MKYFLILLFLTNTHSLVHEKTNERIFNGSEAPLNAFPWMVSVRFNLLNTLKSDCGGAILSDIFLLTAASCFQGFTILTQYSTVTAGIHNFINRSETTEQKRIISHIIVHPDYSPQNFVNDLALVRVTQPFDFSSSSVSSISLSNLTSIENMDLVTIGWGILNQLKPNISAANLQQVTVRENVECTKNKAINSTIQICATGKN